MSGKSEEVMSFENIELEPILKDEITGIVLSPVKDGQGHVVSEQEIEEACQIWNEAFQHLTIQHRDRQGSLINLEELTNPKTFESCFDSDFEILSSFTTDSQSVLNGESIPAGSWLLNLKVKNPAIFELIREGILNGYSIGALGIKNKNGTVRISNLIAPEVSIVKNPANQRNWLIIKDEDFEEIRKPLAGWHSCRLKNPETMQADSFKTIEQELKDGRKVNIIIARPKGKEKATAQAIRYPVGQFTEEESRRRCLEKSGTFEPAKEE